MYGCMDVSMPTCIARPAGPREEMPLKKDCLSLLLPYTPTHIPTYIYPCTHTPIYVSMYLDIHLYIWMDVYREIGALQAGPGGEMPLKKDRLSLLLPHPSCMGRCVVMHSPPCNASMHDHMHACCMPSTFYGNFFQDLLTAVHLSICALTF